MNQVVLLVNIVKLDIIPRHTDPILVQHVYPAVLVFMPMPRGVQIAKGALKEDIPSYLLYPLPLLVKPVCQVSIPVKQASINRVPRDAQRVHFQPKVVSPTVVTARAAANQERTRQRLVFNRILNVLYATLENTTVKRAVQHRVHWRVLLENSVMNKDFVQILHASFVLPVHSPQKLGLTLC
jgi:hypothetical protein